MSASLFSPRLIAAKKQATCWTCSQPIQAGAPIYWHKGGWRAPSGQFRSPVWHQACAQPITYRPPTGAQDDGEPDTSTEPNQPVSVQQSAPQAQQQPDTAHNGHAPSVQASADPLAQLAAALAPHLSQHQKVQPIDEQAVKAIAGRIFQAGLPTLEQRITSESRRTAEEREKKLREEVAGAVLEATKRADEAAEKVAQALAALEAPKVDAAEIERHAYEGTKRAIIEAQDAGADVSKLPVPVPVPALDPLYQADTSTGEDVRFALATGRHCLVSGPSGSGKTYPVRMECARAGRPVVELSAGDGIGYTHLVGSVTLERDAQGGIITGWRDGALLRAMRAGAVLLLDEADQLPRPLLALLYGILEPGRTAELYVPELGASVQAKPGFQVAATGNTVRDATGLYSGERPSAALLNRMACIAAEYLSAAQECAIFERCGLEKPQAHAIVRALAALRKDYDAGALTVAPSTRTGVQVSRALLGLMPDGSTPKGIAQPLKPSRAWGLYLLGALPNEEAKRASLAIQSAYAAGSGATWS